MQNTKPVVVPIDMDISSLNAVKSFTVEATAYTYTGNPTATGVYPREGLIAVDPRVIPLGTQVYVEGYGYAVAADTGGAIKGNIIDVFFPSLKRCLDWGRRPVTIYILAGK
jgi:3D (Asp-Asp-Asp) domain-containing protein